MIEQEALQALIVAVETGAWSPGRGKGESWVYPTDFFGWDTEPAHARNAALAFEGSLDAAKALHEALLAGWPWTVEKMNDGLSRAWTNKARNLRCPGFSGKASCPARAWLIAILEALLSQTEAK